MTDNQNPDAVRDAIATAEKPKETIFQVVERLIKLHPLEYEQVRETEAKALGVRVSVLDKEVENASRPIHSGPAEMFPSIEPYADNVDGAGLLDEIANTIRQFIVCNPETVTAATLWITFTWLIDRIQVAPLAVITAPEKRCGKSQLLDLIGRLSRRPLVASNISPAAIFRVIEAHAPTLLIDEADAFLKDNEEARGILNSGHTRQSAYVIRVVGEDHEPRQFSTWGAKAISGIGALSDTLMDRAIVLELRRKLPQENVERLRHAAPEHFKCLASKLARYAEDNGRAIEIMRPILPDNLNDRAQDNWEPLLAIADLAGGIWPELARKAALRISGKEQEAPSLSAELLSDIQEVIIEKFKWDDNIPSRKLLEELNADDLKPWATYNRGKPMSPRQLAKRLGEYHIKPQNLCVGNARPKGYRKEQFEDVFTRYLTLLPTTPEKSATPLRNGHNVEPEPYAEVAAYVLRSTNVNPSAICNPAETSHCSGIADKTPDIEVEEERLAIQQFDGGMQ